MSGICKVMRSLADLNDSISPSVYVIYSSVRASASCVALVNSHIPIGSVHTAVTRAYEPNVLSTAICEALNMGAGIGYCISPVGEQVEPADCFQGIDNGWRQINFSELYDPPPASDLLTRYQSCFPTRSISADFASMRFVKPQLAFPPDVTDIDPVWATWGGSTCTPVNLGVYDPPRVLEKATALVPMATPAADPQVLTVPPSPAAILTSPVAAPTKAVANHDPDTSAKANKLVSRSAGTATPTKAQPDLVAIVDPVDPSVIAQNEGSQGTGNSNAVKATSNSHSKYKPNPPNAGSNSDLKSDPVSGDTNNDPLPSDADTTPADTEKQSGANVATNSGKHSGTDSGTGNNDQSTAPITLVPQQSADTAKENSGTSGTSGKTGVTTGVTKGGTNGGTTGGTGRADREDLTEVTSGGGQGNGSGDEEGRHGMNEGISDATNDGTSETNEVTSGGNETGSNGGTNDGKPNSVSLASLNNQPVTKDTSGNILLSGSTLAPGRTMTFSGHTVANAPSAVIMDGSTYAPSPTTPSASPLLVDNQLLQMTNGGLEIGSQTLVPGTRTTINNHVIHYANPSQVIKDAVTHNLAPVSSSNPLVLDGQTLLRAPNGGLITAGTTIAPGSTATVGGHIYSLAGSSSVIVDGGNTYALPAMNNAYQIQLATSGPPQSSTTLPIFSLLTLANGLVITPKPQPSTPNSNNKNNNLNYLLPNGASLSPGGPAAIYSGTTYSVLPSNAGILAIETPSGSSSATTTTLAIPIPTPTPNSQLQVRPGSQSVFTVAGEVFTSIGGAAGSETGVQRIVTGTGLGGAVVSGFGRGGKGTDAEVFEGGAVSGRKGGGLGLGVGRVFMVVVGVGLASGLL